MINQSAGSTATNNSGFQANAYSMKPTAQFFRILSDSLYENKELAVLRELSANALDAHIAAGKSTTPITVILPTELSPELVIIDEGVGMSLEELSTLYTTYGSSNKDDTNDVVGGFGLGSKSPFALTEAFTVTSTKSGITTVASCFLDEGLPNFIVISSTQTDKPSGTTVTVPISSESSIDKLFDLSTTLYQYWEVLPNVQNGPPNLLHSYNADIQTSKRVAVSSAGILFSKAVVGPFTYNILESLQTAVQQRLSEDKEAVANYYTIYNIKLDTHHHWNLKGFTLFYDIGQMALAPSRENLDYTESNVTTAVNSIKAFLADAVKELDQYVTELKPILTAPALPYAKIISYLQACRKLDILDNEVHKAVLRKLVSAEKSSDLTDKPITEFNEYFRNNDYSDMIRNEALYSSSLWSVERHSSTVVRKLDFVKYASSIKRSLFKKLLDYNNIALSDYTTDYSVINLVVEADNKKAIRGLYQQLRDDIIDNYPLVTSLTLAEFTKLFEDIGIPWDAVKGSFNLLSNDELEKHALTRTAAKRSSSNTRTDHTIVARTVAGRDITVDELYKNPQGKYLLVPVMHNQSSYQESSAVENLTKLLKLKIKYSPDITIAYLQKNSEPSTKRCQKAIADGTAVVLRDIEDFTNLANINLVKVLKLMKLTHSGILSAELLKNEYLTTMYDQHFVPADTTDYFQPWLSNEPSIIPFSDFAKDTDKPLYAALQLLNSHNRKLFEEYYYNHTKTNKALTKALKLYLKD